MRISDDRYSRDRQRFDIALRFIRYEARTHTIRAWTGLTDDRIRKLYRSYLWQPHGTSPTRHRGRSPQQPGFFIRTARARAQSSLFAGLCRLLGALPPSTQTEQPLPSLPRAARLCQAFDAYRGLVHDPLISFEHAVFLLGCLARGDELSLGLCGSCGALLVIDRWSLRTPHCAACSEEQRLCDAHTLPLALETPG